RALGQHHFRGRPMGAAHERVPVQHRGCPVSYLPIHLTDAMNGEGRTSESSAAPPTNGAESGFTAPDFRWQALFQRSLEPVFVLNRGRRILFVNRAWQELTGVAAAEARGRARVRRAPMPQDPWDAVSRSLCCPARETLRGRAG